jgi:hypothetical protein
MPLLIDGVRDVNILYTDEGDNSRTGGCHLSL